MFEHDIMTNAANTGGEQLPMSYLFVCGENIRSHVEKQ